MTDPSEPRRELPEFEVQGRADIIHLLKKRFPKKRLAGERLADQLKRTTLTGWALAHGASSPRSGPTIELESGLKKMKASKTGFAKGWEDGFFRR
jgi:hypothetical protein